MAVKTEIIYTIQGVKDWVRLARDKSMAVRPPAGGGQGDFYALGARLFGELSDWHLPAIHVNEEHIAMMGHRVSEFRVDQNMLLQLDKNTNEGLTKLTISSSVIEHMYGVPFIAFFPAGNKIAQNLRVDARELNVEGMYNSTSLGNIVSEVTGDTEVISIFRCLQDVYGE